jgi:hypothetical protein
MMDVDFGIDLDSILDVFNDEKKEPMDFIEAPVNQEETPTVAIPMHGFKEKERPKCPHCDGEVAKYMGHPSVSWYCFCCCSFILERDLKEKEND